MVKKQSYSFRANLGQSYNLTANLNDDRDVFSYWSSSDQNKCSISGANQTGSIYGQPSISFTVSNSASGECSLNAWATQQYEADIYGSCGSCTQYQGAGGCQSKAYYTHTTHGTPISCSAGEVVASGKTAGYQCCWSSWTLSSPCNSRCSNGAGAIIYNKINDYSHAYTAYEDDSIRKSSNKAYAAISRPGNDNWYWAATSPTQAGCYYSTKALFAMLVDCNNSTGGASLYIADNFDESGCVYTRSTTTYNYDTDCTGNKRTIVKVVAGTGISSVSPTLWQRMWKGSTKSISATVQSGKIFDRWTVSGGCSVSSPTSASTVVSGGSSDCTVTATAKDTPSQVTLTINGQSAGCSLSTSYQVDAGGTKRVSVALASGYEFTGWVSQGSCTFANSSLQITTVTMKDSDCTIKPTCYRSGLIGGGTGDCVPPRCPPYPCQQCAIK